MAFTAGATLFVLSDKMIPETHRRGYERVGTGRVIPGFVPMMFLDLDFGQISR